MCIVVFVMVVGGIIWVRYYYLSNNSGRENVNYSGENLISTSTPSALDETTWKFQAFNGQWDLGPLCYTFRYPASYTIAQQGEESLITDTAAVADTMIIRPYAGVGNLSDAVSGNTYSSEAGTVLKNVSTTGGFQGEGVFPTNNAWTIYIAMTPSSSDPILDINPGNQYWNSTFSTSVAEGIAESIAACQ